MSGQDRDRSGQDRDRSGQDCKKKNVTWLARDVRDTKDTGTKPRVQPKPNEWSKVKRGKGVCSLCRGICCGAA